MTARIPATVTGPDRSTTKVNPMANHAITAGMCPFLRAVPRLCRVAIGNTSAAPGRPGNPSSIPDSGQRCEESHLRPGTMAGRRQRCN